MDKFVSLNLRGQAPTFRQALGLIEKFGACDATVLILGETGTGKELAARAIHYLSSRRDSSFVPINCGALPDDLIDSELFGHRRGAFTDAKEEREGLIAYAEGGTVFLDEIEAMSPRTQITLLRFLQDKQYRRVGSSTPRTANVRIVSASNADLHALAKKALFRSDLLFRLNVLVLNLPPLRDRPGDAILLAHSFLQRLNAEAGKATPKFLDPSAEPFLEKHNWPGNVRELENLIARRFFLTEGHSIEISADELFATSACCADGIDASANEAYRVAKARAVAHFEKSYILSLLSRARGNLTLASRLSGKDRSDLGKLVRKYGLCRHEFADRSGI
jgi:DNA-binding NtrC family response regulator